MSFRIAATLIFNMIVSILPGQSISFEMTDQAAGWPYQAYLLVENKIIVTMENAECSSLYLTTNNGLIRRDTMHNCTYWYIPNRLEKSDILIYRISREDTILIETKSVKTKTWPFTATLTGYTNNSIIKKIELANLSLSVQSLNTGLSAIATINSFEITIVRKENIIYHKKLDDVDAKLYRHSQEELEIVKEGDYINYSNILYRLGEHLIPVEPLRIKLE